jgi:hypothetical protein
MGSQELGPIPEDLEVVFDPMLSAMIVPCHIAAHAQHSAEQCCTRPCIMPSSNYEEYLHLMALTAEATETEHMHGTATDIHADANAMLYLGDSAAAQSMSTTESRRVKRRTKQYMLDGIQIIRMMADGSRRIVPPPTHRLELIRATHERAGHFGIKRTTNLLMNSYWWDAMRKDVSKVLATCEVCSTVRSHLLC